MAIGSPMALVFAGVGIEDDNAVIAVAIGYIQFVRLRIHVQLRRAFQVLQVVATLALAGFANLHEKLARLREFQNHVVVVISGRRILAFWRRATGSSGGLAGARAAITADPNIALVVHKDPVIGFGPVVPLAWSTPGIDESASSV